MGHLFQGGLPPLPGGGGINIQQVLLNMLFAVLWAIVGSIGFAGAISIALRVLNVLTPGFNEWDEIKRGNMAVAVLWSAFVIAVRSATVSPAWARWTASGPPMASRAAATTKKRLSKPTPTDRCDLAHSSHRVSGPATLSD